MTTVRRDRTRGSRRLHRRGFRARRISFAATLERLADDGATLCACADGRRCVA